MVKLTACVARTVAARKGFKCGKWNTEYRGGRTIVKHYGTEMLSIDHSAQSAKRATGFESMSDKQGVNKVLRDLGIDESKVEKVHADRGFSFE